MSDDFSLVEAEVVEDNFFTTHDEELVKTKLIDLRSKGRKDNAQTLAQELKPLLPSISEATIKQIESSPGYATKVLQSHMGKIAASLDGVIDKLIDKASSGDLKAITLLLEVAGSSKKQGTIYATQNNLNLKGLPEDRLFERMGKLSQHLDRQR
jgi:hypothetical protein